MSNTTPLIWTDDPGKKYCVLLALNGVEDSWQISKGIPRAKDFPEDAYFQMDKQFKKNVALSDALANLESMPLISARFREFVEARSPKQVEFLKVKVLDHKEKEIKEDYYILHPTAVVDCIDVAQSNIMWNALDPELIASVFKLVLKPDPVDPDLLVYRPKHRERNVFFRRDFAEALKATDFTGFAFTEPAKFVG